MSTASSKQLREQTLKVLSDALDVSVQDLQRNMRTKLEDLGFNSLAVVEVILALEEHLNIEIPDMAEDGRPNIDKDSTLADTIERALCYARKTSPDTTVLDDSVDLTTLPLSFNAIRRRNRNYIDIFLRQDFAQAYLNDFNILPGRVRELVLDTLGSRPIQAVASAVEGGGEGAPTVSAHFFFVCPRTFFHFALSSSTVAFWTVPLTDLVIEVTYSFSDTGELERTSIAYAARIATPRFLGSAPAEWDFTGDNARRAQKFMQRLMKFQQEASK